MKIHLGLSFDESIYPDLPGGSNMIWNEIFVGEKGFVSLLETHLGLSALEIPNYKRLVALQKSLSEHLESIGVFKDSFVTDPLATSRFILKMRDELLLAGWDFVVKEGISPKLKSLSLIESNINIKKGYADRVLKILKSDNFDKVPVKEILIYQARKLFPPFINKILSKCELNGIKIYDNKTGIRKISNDRDIDLVIKTLQNKKLTENPRFKKDGSFQIITGLDSQINARYLALLLKENPDVITLLYDKDNDIQIHESQLGYQLQSSGVKVKSEMALPIQLLKIVFNLFWEPINPYHMMEFLSMKLNPLPSTIRLKLARLLSDYPGRGNQKWNELIAEEKEKIENKDKQKSFHVWTELLTNGQTFKKGEGMPVEFVKEILKLLSDWASKQMKLEGEKVAPRARSCGYIFNLVSTFHEYLLTRNDEELICGSELSELFDEISSDYMVVNEVAEVESLPRISSGFSIYSPSTFTVWWNCYHKPSVIPLDMLHHGELTYLSDAGVDVLTKKKALEIRKLSYINLLSNSENIMLFVPSLSAGNQTDKHLLLARLEATFDNLRDVTINLSSELFKAPKGFTLTSVHSVKQTELPNYPHSIQFDATSPYKTKEREAFSSLEKLVNYPTEYFFANVAKIKKSTSFSLNNVELLNGNLAHEFIEKIIISENFIKLDYEEISSEVNKLSLELLPQQGSHLLIEGKENERRLFLSHIKKAINSLRELIEENEFTIVPELVEKGFTTQFYEEVELYGITDLVFLDKNNKQVIIDLKWGSFTNRKEKVEKSMDLQLPIYAKLTDPEKASTPTAYFIIKNSRLISRFPNVFGGATALKMSEDDPNQLQVFERLKQSYQYRIAEFSEGIIEAGENVSLDDLPSASWINALDVPTEKKKKAISKYSNYTTFIKLD